MFTLGPYTVSGSPITLNVQQANTQSSQPIVGALVYNNSNETFEIEWAGISDWLHPYSIYTVNATGNNFPNIRLTPQDDTGSGSVYSTVYQQGDAMPANVPTTISATNLNIAPGATVDVGTVAGNIGIVNPSTGDTTNVAITTKYSTSSAELTTATNLEYNVPVVIASVTLSNDTTIAALRFTLELLSTYVNTSDTFQYIWSDGNNTILSGTFSMTATDSTKSQTENDSTTFSALSGDTITLSIIQTTNNAIWAAEGTPPSTIYVVHSP